MVESWVINETKRKFTIRGNRSQQVSRQNPYLRGVQKQKQGRHHHKTYKNANTLFAPQKAYMSQHAIFARNKFPAADLEKGWIIESGAHGEYYNTNQQKQQTT